MRLREIPPAAGTSAFPLRKYDGRGSPAVVFSLAAFPAILFAGAAIDYAQLVRSRTELQHALDRAVLAGAKAASAQRNSVAATILAGVIASSSFTDVTADWKNNPDGSFSGLATASRTLLFASVFGQGAATIGAAATAAVAVDHLAALDPCRLAPPK